MSAYGYALVSRSVRDVNPGMSGEFIEIVVTRLDVGPDAVRAAAELLPDGERQRATRFAFDRDRCRFVVARSRLRQLLGERLEVGPDGLELAYGVRGKPGLAGRFADSDLRFNLSHCDDVAVYALSHGREVGIDVEAVRVVPDADAIAACMFSRAENEVYRALDARDKPVGFFNCWTRKEAFIKALGVQSAPYLADHGFHDMVVLPGSFYIDTALRVHRDRGNPVAGVVRNVSFHNPIILSTQDTVVEIAVRNLGDGRVEYTFYEAGTEDGRAKLPERQYAARLEIDSAPAPSRRPGTDPFSIEAFQARSQVVIDSGSLYAKLRDNGNQYGPTFQRISSIWRAGDQCLGRLSVARPDGDVESHAVHPSVLDSMTQVLAPFVMEQGKTFILRSIDMVELAGGALARTTWGVPVLPPG